jgi:hypothetical protein
LRVVSARIAEEVITQFLIVQRRRVNVDKARVIDDNFESLKVPHEDFRVER